VIDVITVVARCRVSVIDRCYWRWREAM